MDEIRRDIKREQTVEPQARLLMNTTMRRVLPGRYQLTAARGGVVVLRRAFDHTDDANRALVEVLVRYLDFEVRLTDGGTALISAGPARPRSR